MAEKPPADTSSSETDFDMMSALDWQNGIATLPGSDIRFRMNEFGALEIITDGEMEAVQAAAMATESSDPSPADKPTSPEEGVAGGTAVVESAEPVHLAPSIVTPEEAPSVEVVSCGTCGASGTFENFEGKFCSKACFQSRNNSSSSSSSRASPVEQKNGETASNPSNESARPLKRIRRKRKLLTESDDEEVENPEEEEEEEKSKVGKGRRAAKQTKLVATASGKKKVWSWPAYLEEEKMIAVPLKLFKEHQSFPQSRNGFKVGMKMEGLDPLHPSMFCVLTVAEVQGYRIRLHFDGYPECYDFWVNADSWDVKPAGWCEKTGNKLLLPKGCKDGEFNWNTYVKNCRGQTAPKHLFKSLNTSVTPSGFRPGMKLEAVDKKNPFLICVASIAALVDNRLLIHFDNWDESYDYWCEASSPYIHPVGFCQEMGLTLTAPAEYKHPKSFSWEKYLEETGTQAAPARAFKQRPPHGFQENMKLEAVDKRNPMLIRVATIAATEEHRLKIHFDGWSQEYDYWVDADSPDIHPVGWCAKTGHPLQNPQGPVDSSTPPGQGCPTQGCHGIGHIKGPRYGTHYTAVSCPYSEINLNKEGLLPDRLIGEKPPTLAGPQKGKRVEAPAPTPTVPEPSDDSPQSRKSWSTESERSGRNSAQCLPEQTPSTEERTEGTGEPSENGIKARKTGPIPKCLKLHLVKQELGDGKETALSLQEALHESVFIPPFSSNPAHRIQVCWEQHCRLLPEVLGLTAKGVAKWTIEEQIDGEAFLLLTQADIVKILGIKLGPALKIYNSILMCKSADEE
ncbi:lethal(3)malignant brain tumor-like protein 4 isoform X3 [Polyodon spathula]|uniref:lethal(3)malignant brain tumor-like protein 4 isoform X3 n=1 Tax=Polyodon spathula TaxID=7913 RepID=UPI001B7EB542|nr:lethal(3)malignant brain tumor-like protein 4 isoform X3 [Polyodon spathula]